MSQSGSLEMNGTHRSQMHTSGAVLARYRASVASPKIHGPGSSRKILASRE